MSQNLPMPVKKLAILVVVLTILAAIIGYPSIQDDLRLRAQHAAKFNDIDWVELTIRGRDVTLDGEAKLRRWVPASLNKVRGVWGVRIAEFEGTKNPPLQPYAFAFEIQAGQAPNAVGYAANSDQREQLRADLASVYDVRNLSIDLADGAPTTWMRRVSTAAKIAQELSDGRVRLLDDTITVEGVAKRRGFAKRWAFVNGMNVNSTVQERSAAPLEIIRNDSSIILDGTVPSQQAQVDLLRLARGRFLGENVVDVTRIDSVENLHWEIAASLALQTLIRVQNGRAVLDENSLLLEGRVYYPAAVDTITKHLESTLPKSYFLTNNLVFDLGVESAAELASNECESSIGNLVKQRVVVFESSSATLSPASIAVLDPIVFTLSRCPTSMVEIAGHTDATGDFEANWVLSEKRAKAVLNYLMNAGVSQERLRSVGFGQTKPRVSGVSDASNARNRRIEFKLLEPTS